MTAPYLPQDFRVATLEQALAGVTAQLDESRAEVASLEDELVAARSLADDWRNIAIQLAATCRDLRGDIEAARWEGYTTREARADAK